MALLSSQPTSDYAFMKHTPPSASSSSSSSPGCRTSSKRNTVHWEKRDLDISDKENEDPETRHDASPLHKSESLGLFKPSQGGARIDLHDRKFRGQQRRAPLAAETFIAPRSSGATSTHAETDTDALGGHDLVKAARSLDPNENVFEQHKKKQFQWVLSLPASAAQRSTQQSQNSPLDLTSHHTPDEGGRRYFGCNLLTWTKKAGREGQFPGDPEDKYLLLATPIDLRPEQSTTAHLGFTTCEFRVLQEETREIEKMAASQTVVNTPTSATSNAYRPSPLSASSAHWSTAVEASEDSDNTLTMDLRHHEMKAPLSTIEDSFEELDMLEDHIEEMADAAAQMSIKDNQQQQQQQQQEKPVAATRSAPQEAHQEGAQAKRSVSARRSTAHDAASLPGSDRGNAQTPTAATLRKVARPASLAPPKPLQKTSKRPTVPTFELPGERVSRELKEKKAARLSMQLVDPQKAAGESASSPQRTRSIRSSKPPTVPKFELPGERYSRQKKERLEQKLKEEEEEARRRRQFKARPSPAKAAPSTVRSTFTSRQRQSTGVQPEQQAAATAESSPKAGAAKRQAVTMTPSAARTASLASVSTATTAVRGRTSSFGSSQVSTRATSSSAGSAVSSTTRKRSSVSAEELQQQKARGRQIYARDNNAGQVKAREEQDRKEAIKLARQKYAEMSRMKAAQGRARRSQQQSSLCAEESAPASTSSPSASSIANPEEIPPRVPQHLSGIGRNF